MNPANPSSSRRLALAGLALTLVSGCGGLLPKPRPLPATFTLDAAAPAAPAAAGQPLRPTARPSAQAAPTLVVNVPQAAAGYDRAHMLYLRRPHQLEYFAQHQWVDTPARMLAPLIVTALEQGGAFGAVVRSPAATDADLRLDTEIVRLQQQFDTQPSQVRFTLRAQLVDSSTRQVLAGREFDASVPALSDDPAGGVVAASAAVQDVLGQLARFCADTSAARPRRSATR